MAETVAVAGRSRDFNGSWGRSSFLRAYGNGCRGEVLSSTGSASCRGDTLPLPRNPRPGVEAAREGGDTNGARVCNTSCNTSIPGACIGAVSGSHGIAHVGLEGLEGLTGLAVNPAVWGRGRSLGEANDIGLSTRSRPDTHRRAHAPRRSPNSHASEKFDERKRKVAHGGKATPERYEPPLRL